MKAKSSNPAGSHFAAITDPGTKLAAIAKENKFRRVFLNPPDIVGCYSVLSYFGLVPAALIGMDLATLVDRAIRMTHSSAGCVRVEENLGVSLGAALGALKKAGRDKLTFIISPPISAFGLWVEQLISESTGKNGIGIVPVCDEPAADAKSYGKDRAFVYLKLSNGADAAQDAALKAIKKAGIPTVQITLSDKIDLGEEFMRWEIASVTAAAVIGVDPFAQPGVQKNNDNTVSIPAPSSRAAKGFPAPSPIAEKGKLALFSGGTAGDALKGKHDFGEIIGAFVNLAETRRLLRRDGVRFTQSDRGQGDRDDSQSDCRSLRHRDDLRLRTAMPAFSTGQLHKGSTQTGLFLQITTGPS